MEVAQLEAVGPLLLGGEQGVRTVWVFCLSKLMLRAGVEKENGLHLRACRPKRTRTERLDHVENL